jgi:hypothetical protein
MKLLVAFAAVIALLLCLPAAASANGYGAPAPVAFVQASAGYGAMVAPVQFVPVQGYSMAPSFGAAGPLYGGSCSGVGFGASPVIVNQTVVRGRPGLLGRLRAARQGFRRGF